MFGILAPCHYIAALFGIRSNASLIGRHITGCILGLENLENLENLEFRELDLENLANLDNACFFEGKP